MKVTRKYVVTIPINLGLNKYNVVAASKISAIKKAVCQMRTDKHNDMTTYDIKFMKTHDKEESLLKYLNDERQLNPVCMEVKDET